MGVIEKFQVQVEAFPFPYQPTPPATKVLSVPSPEIKLHQARPAKDSEEVESSYKPSHPFLTNVGKLNGARIVRGGFGVTKAEKEYLVDGMRCFPPPPNAAYALTSQAYALKDSTSVRTPSSTREGSEEVDVTKMTGMQVSLVMDVEEQMQCSKKLDRNANEEADIKEIMGLEFSLRMDRLQRLKNLDGTAHEDVIAPTSVEYLNGITYPQQTFNLFIAPKKMPPSEVGLVGPRQKTIGEALADTIDFERDAWVMRAPGVSGELYPAKEQRVSTVGSFPCPDS